MKKLFKKIALLLTVITVGIMCVIPTTAVKASDTAKLGALADSYKAQGGTYELTTSSRIFVVSSSKPTGELLQTVQLIQSQFAAKGHPSNDVLEMVWGPESYAKTGDVVLKLDSDSSVGTEGYKLDVADKAIVTASDVDGLLYGANMLQKHFIYAGKTSISGFVASDVPDTKERTVMLDTGRKYYTAEWIKNFIKQISWMGYNTIELHFSEDGGFRADFWDPEYYTDNYKPDNDFSWLCGSHVQSWVKDPYRTDPDAGKYLTTKELVEILEVAKKYHIDVIPSFDSPAHMDYITWKFEQNYKSNTSYSFVYDGTTYNASKTKGCINYTNKTGESSPTWPYYTTVDITEGTMAEAFVLALYEDIADFFKEYAGSSDFSIGADEVNLSTSNLKNGESFTWGYPKFVTYVNKLNRLLNNKGYTMRMFNDYIGSTTYNQSSDEKAVYEFDKNIEIMYWNSDYNPTTGKYNTTDNKTWHVAFFWYDGTNTENAGTSWPSTGWGDGGRTIYNCIQTHCYYVLRVAASNTDYPNMDARNPENYNWSFYHSTEENIYNEWYPADISEKGLNTENAADVPDQYLGGAYFLIWNDYAALNTESEVWNGVKDNTGTSSYTYSLFNRMWSNITKMWNSDINSTVDYADFEDVRSTFGYFPGYTSCSAAASLPSATDISQAYLADHSELNALLASGKMEQGTYTDESYALYESAYSAAEEVNKDYAATQSEVDAAVANLTETIEGLSEINKDALNKLISNVEKLNSDNYTADSWTILAETLVNAKEVQENSLSQTEVESAYNSLYTAFNGLEINSEINVIETDKIISIEKLSNTFIVGKQVGLKLTTSVDVDSLSVASDKYGVETLNLCTGKEQTLKDGSNVKIWLVYFTAKEGNEDDTLSYAIQINGTEYGEWISVTVK